MRALVNRDGGALTRSSARFYGSHAAAVDDKEPLSEDSGEPSACGVSDRRDDLGAVRPDARSGGNPD